MAATFKDYLTEKFINLFFDDPDKEKYVDDVWKILQTSYKKVGGLQGKGFSTKQDMLDSIPFWKIIKKGGKIVAVLMYKDQDGRKRVALGTDGSDIGKKMLGNAMTQEFERGFSEVSDGSWRFIRKILPEEYLKQKVKNLVEVRLIQKSKKIYSLDEVPKSEWVTKMDKGKLETDTFSGNYYLREIGGKLHVKIMLGMTGLGIKK